MGAPGADEHLPAAVAETHISVITMIGDRAYKLLKPVRLPFLDHRRREHRHAACRRETEVNRRFAPDVYLGVLDVVDEAGRPVDHLIAMRRMPPRRRLSALLDGPEAGERVDEVARWLAEVHLRAPRGPHIDRAGTADAVAGLWREGLDQLAAAAPGVIDPAAIEEVRRRALRYVEGRRELFAARIARGWVRDGHGDLLADDVFCLPDGPRVLDCLAFDDRLRFGDVLLDAAFLAMDLESRGHPEQADRLLGGWEAAVGEEHPASLAHHYVAYRAHVRTKVACLRAAQGDRAAAGEARRLQDLCADRLDRGRVRLVLVGGAPGTGKSTVAAALGAARGWPVLGSDALRKEAEGRPARPGDPGPFAEGRYAPEITGRVYAAMLDRAADLLALGRSVVLDASWSDAGRREAARTLAAGRAADLVEIRCDLPADAAARRILARRAAGEGPSDATPEIARRLAAAFAAWPEADVLDTTSDRDAVAVRAAALAGRG